MKMSDSIWYKKLGFYNNPFSIKPAIFNNELFGNSLISNSIIKKMYEPRIVFISGEFGTGKTTILKKIIAEFRGNFWEGKKVIYYNCNQSEESIDYERLLINASGFLKKLFKIKKKGMIILLDEMQDMNKKDMHNVKKYYDEGFFRSVVFVSKYEDVELTKELEDEISENKFKLDNMTKKEAVEMIRKRIGNIRFIDDEMIMSIFSKDKNSRNFLKNCEDVCRYAFECGDHAVLDRHIKKVLE